MSRGTLDPAASLPPSPTGLSPSPAGLSRTVWLASGITCAVRTPVCTHTGLGSSGFARRYSRNRFFFLFLRLLRCFSSPGSPHMPMDSAYGGGGVLHRVSPFRDLRINACLRLPAAFRSLPRLSSAPGAKASAPRPSLLNRPLFMPSVALLGFSSSGCFTHPHSAVAAPCGACFYFLGCFVLSRFSQTQDTMNIPCLPALPIHEILIFQYSVFKVQYGSCLLSGYTPQGLSRLSGLKWTRTTDLTLIRRAL